MNRKSEVIDMDPATYSQILYIQKLCTLTGNDPDDYNLDRITKQAASELITALMEEL